MNSLFLMRRHRGHLELNSSLVVLAKCEESVSRWANIAERLISSPNDFVNQPFEIITIIPISFKGLLAMSPLSSTKHLGSCGEDLFLLMYILVSRSINSFVNSIFVSISLDCSIFKRLTLHGNTVAKNPSYLSKKLLNHSNPQSFQLYCVSEVEEEEQIKCMFNCGKNSVKISANRFFVNL